MNPLIAGFKAILIIGVISISIHSDLLGQENLRRAFQPAHVVNKTPYGANPSAGQYVQTDDVKIYYEVYGEGEPILLLHGGLFGSTIEFSDLIDKLKRHYRVICVSTRGHGKSEMGTAPLTLDQRANDAMAVISAVTKDCVTVIGFSDGGYTAYKIGAMYPDRVRKMIVIGAGELRPGIRAFQLTSSQAIAMDKRYWEQQLKLMPEPDRLEEIFTQVANCYNQLTVSKDLLSRIKCPVLVMAGDKDEGNPVERVISAARFIPDHQICIIPNAGHGCHNDNFAASWESISPFLKKSNFSFLSLSKDIIEPCQVSCSFTDWDNLPVLKVIKDPSILPVDEPTFAKVKGVDFRDGVIEVKVLSRLLNDAPDYARGFIGIAFRISEDNSRFESIYIRPTNGRAEAQVRRNRAIQYFSYPNYKFDRLRKESPEIYESYADMGLDEWITLKIVVNGTMAKLYLNDNHEPSLIVNDLKHGAIHSGNIGLWVDVGTEGYFKDLKITAR
jgi:pimeloyl-ACP methyl ester carboxylesterase